MTKGGTQNVVLLTLHFPNTVRSMEQSNCNKVLPRWVTFTRK